MYSFYTERTAEYTLVPRFLEILDKLGDVAPVYFWKTREGNKTSQSIHLDEEVYVIAFFARRPKVTPGNTRLTQGKINSKLFEFSSHAQKLEIPVFCGFLEAHSIFDLRKCTAKWFYVDPNLPGTDVVFNIFDKTWESLSDTAEGIKPIAEKEVIRIIENCAYKMRWDVAVERMAELHRKPEEEYNFAPWWTRSWYYKPVYFLVK
ncbi:hypothetical protein [Billgrantia endophytica]|uniref:hypothetical protein n=1 Tax=Billgrantia endophytica TaxID=2033802 RepID=UPI001056AB66|nr:hypothetical protein [Halomonas endophytica]